MDTVSLWHMCMLAKYVAGISLGLYACVYIRKISKGFALCEEVAVTDRTQAVPPRGWPRWQHLAVPIKNSCCWASGAKESPRCPQVHLKADFLTVYCLALPVPVNFTRRCFTSSERESEGGWDRRKRKTFIDFYATTTLIVPKWKALSLTCHAWPTPTSRSFWPISPHSLDRFQPQRGSWHKNHTDMLRLHSYLNFSPVINKKKKKRPTGSSRWLILTNPEHANNYDRYVNSFVQSRKCPTAIFVNASNCCSS